MPRCQFYVVRKKGGEEGVGFFSHDYIRGHGGITAFESELREESEWFYPLGVLYVPQRASHFDHPRFPRQKMIDLVVAWLEQGRPKLAGNIVPAVDKDQAPDESARWIRKYHIYKICEEQGSEKVMCFTEGQVSEEGGISGLESTISENTIWFHLLGVLELPFYVESQGGIQIPAKHLNALAKTWEAGGSPRIAGKLKPKKPNEI